MTGMFIEVLRTRARNAYFTYDLDGIDYLNVSGLQDAVFFTNSNFNVIGRADGLFATDVTSRDDLILAFLSLLLILVTEGIATTILLRTRKGNVKNFGFSAFQLIELVRDFKFGRVLSGQNSDGSKLKKINWRLVALAFSLLSFTFGLEVLALFLTAPKLTDITNKTVSLRILVPVIPRFNKVWWHPQISIGKPCSSLRFRHVEQGRTSLIPCVVGSVTGTQAIGFEKAVEVFDVIIRSDVHKYGAEHFVSIGNLSASYSTRARFALDDEKARLMPQLLDSANETRDMKIVHLQFMAYLFSAYKRFITDKRMDLTRLNNLSRTFNYAKGPKIEVLKVGGKPLLYPSTRYTSTLRGIVPYGSMALHFGHHFFRASAAVIVGGPDETDLFLDSGERQVHAVVWRERSRRLNLVSLGFVFLVALLMLTGLRKRLRPVSTAEIAAVLVRRDVCAAAGRTPVEVAYDERLYFRLYGASEGGRSESVGTYQFGAGAHNALEDKGYGIESDEDF